MSFDFSPNINLSNVQASHKTTDGGGGNTGYFQRREQEDESLISFKKDDNDVFDFSEKKETEEIKTSLISKIISFINEILFKFKKFLLKLFK